jgi:hypothetical protein
MATQTVNYSFDLPTVGGDSDIWGGFLNVNWSDIDGILFAVSGVADQGVADAATAQAAAVAAQGSADAAQGTADAAVIRAGDTMTGQLVLPTGGTGDEAITVTEANAVADAAAGLVDTDLLAHLADLANPHVVTTTQIGALPIAGGTMTGDLITGPALSIEETVDIAGEDITSSAAITIDWAGPSRK